MKSCIQYFKSIVRSYIDDEMSVYAAQASFFMILAVFPFFMLLLSLIDWIPILQESDLLAGIVDLLPDNLDALAITIIHDVESSTSAALLSFSALTSIWSSSKGMLSIERGLNRAYGIEVTRNYFIRRLVCSGYTLVFTCFCAISLIFFGVGSVFMIFLFLWVLYMVLPYQKQNLLHQLPGTLFTTFGWSLFSWAFSFYFRNFAKFIPTYGSLTAVILLMLWLYWGICILFIGAELNAVTEPDHTKNSR